MTARKRFEVFDTGKTTSFTDQLNSSVLADRFAIEVPVQNKERHPWMALCESQRFADCEVQYR
jgi:hypothetical protein